MPLKLRLFELLNKWWIRKLTVEVHASGFCLKVIFDVDYHCVTFTHGHCGAWHLPGNIKVINKWKIWKNILHKLVTLLPIDWNYPSFMTISWDAIRKVAISLIKRTIKTCLKIIRFQVFVYDFALENSYFTQWIVKFYVEIISANHGFFVALTNPIAWMSIITCKCVWLKIMSNCSYVNIYFVLNALVLKKTQCVPMHNAIFAFNQ